MIYLDTIKTWGYMALGLIIIGFLGIFKARGVKIEAQAREIEDLEAEGKAKDYEGDDRVNKAIAEAQDADDIYPDGDYRP